MQRIVKYTLSVFSEPISGRITSTTFPSERLQEQGALTHERRHGLNVCRCVQRLVMKFTYATEPPIGLGKCL